MKEKAYTLKSVWIFFILMGGISAACEIITIVQQKMGFFTVILMFSPCIAALCAYLFGIRKKSASPNISFYLGLKKCKLKYILAGMMAPMLYVAIPYLAFGLTNPESMKNINPLHLTINFVIGMLSAVILSAGEELGWRGFMVPSLFERLGLNKTLMITSLIWGMWHVPLIASGLYMEKGNIFYQIIAFLMCIIPIGIIAGLLTIQSKSVWPAVILHAVHNNLNQILAESTNLSEQGRFIYGEVGIITIILSWSIAAVCYFRYKKALRKE